MKLFKLIVTLILLAFIGVFIGGNLSTFNTSVPFQLNLYVIDVIQWQHRVYTLMAAALGLGLLLGVLAMIKPYLKLRNTLKQEREARSHAEVGQDQVISATSQETHSEVAAPAQTQMDPRDSETRTQ